MESFFWELPQDQTTKMLYAANMSKGISILKFNEIPQKATYKQAHTTGDIRRLLDL